MTTESLHGVVIKVFIGCRITSEIRMALSMSETWKLANDIALSEIHTDDGEYIGIPIDSGIVPLDDLRKHGAEVIELLQEHCPGLPIELQDLSAFPQVFLA